MRRTWHLAVIMLLWTGAAPVAALHISEGWRFDGGAAIGPPTLHRAEEAGPIRGIVFTVADGRLLYLDGEGTVVWTHPIARLSQSAPAVADVDDDGQCEVVVADFEGLLLCLSGTGEVEWTQRLRGGIFQQGGAGICDLDGDGSKEIIVGDRTGKVWCLDGRGRVRWTLDLGRRWVSMPTCADLDGDGMREIVVGEVDRHLYCLDASGQWLWEAWRNDEVFGNSGCAVADLTGDGLPEVLVGGGLNHFLALDGRTGKYLREINTKQHINSTMAVSDLDRDGRTDVIFGTRQGTLWRIGAEGRVVWQQQYADAILTPLCIADLTGGPEFEIATLISRSHLSVVDCRGNEITRHDTGCGDGSAPAVGDVDGDGYLEVIMPDAGDTQLVCLKTDAPARKGAVAWESMRGDAACTGNPSSIRAASRADAPIATSDSARLSMETRPAWLAGPNECTYRVENPARRRLLLSFSCKKPGGVVERQFRHSSSANDRLTCPVLVDRDGPYSVEAQLFDIDRRRLLAAEHFSETVDLFAPDIRYAQQALTRAHELTASLHSGNPPEFRRLTQMKLEIVGHIDELRKARRERASAVGTAAVIASTTAARGRINHVLALAEVASARLRAGLNHKFVAWPGFAWHHFDGKEAVPSAERESGIAIEAYVGEREWAVVNLTSFADRLIRFRVEVTAEADPASGTRLPLASLQVFEAVDAPTLEGLMVADALVPLSDSSMIAVAPWESRQLWVRVWLQGAEPGEYSATLRFTSVEPAPESQEMKLHIRVWPMEIPLRGRLRFVNWAVSGGKDDAFRDTLAREAVEHGVNVFPCGLPVAHFDSDGRLTKQIDYSHHDRVVCRFTGHGRFLFSSPQHHVRVEGADMFSEKWIAAYTTYLSEWRRHLTDLGVSLENCYLYPVDEASIAGSASLKELTDTARITKQIDAKIRIFANPSMGATVEGLTELSQYVDVWCPSQELMDREGKPLLNFFKRTAEEVWFYDARGNSRTLSGLAFFRRQAWQAWHHGLNGMGFFACMASPQSAWVGADGSAGYFDVVYPGRSPVTSKRYEAAADGREDFEAMCILREAVENAKAAGTGAEAVREAEELLTARAEEIWQAIDSLDDRCEIMTDGLEAIEVAHMLRDFRRRAAELTAVLRSGRK